MALVSTYVNNSGCHRELRRIHQTEVNDLIASGDVIVPGNFQPNCIATALTCAADPQIKRNAQDLCPAPKSALLEKNLGNKEEMRKYLMSFNMWSDQTIQEEIDFLFAVPMR